MILLCLRQRSSPQNIILCSLWTPEKLPVQPKAEQSLGSPETVQLQATVMLKEYHDLQLQYQMLVPQKIYLPGWAPSSAPWSGGTETKLRQAKLRTLSQKVILSIKSQSLARLPLGCILLLSCSSQAPSTSSFPQSPLHSNLS